MTRLASTLVVLLTFIVQANIAVHAQDSASETPEAVGDPSDADSTEDNSILAYYVVDDSEDIWPEEAITDEQSAEDQAAPDQATSEEGAADTPENSVASDQTESGVRKPPGLPLVEARPTVVASVPRSLGGVRVADAAAPWQAQIYYPKAAPEWNAQIAAGEKLWVMQHYCGGALVARDWVLTAAHCIDENMMAAGYRVRLGQERIDLEGGWTFKIDKVVQNDKYVALNGGDIALIHIVKDQQQSDPPQQQVRPIALFRGPDPAISAAMTAFGWGRVGNAGSRSSAVLLKVDLKIVDRPSCDKALKPLVDLRVVCAGAPDQKTCSNDSGGPLVNSANQLVGIVSGGGRSCAKDNVPGIYTRVDAYLSWIAKVTDGAVR